VTPTPLALDWPPRWRPDLGEAVELRKRCCFACWRPAPWADDYRGQRGGSDGRSAADRLWMPACGARCPPHESWSRRFEGPRCGTEEILGRSSLEEPQPATWATGSRPDPA